jgi:hypothetical protein
MKYFAYIIAAAIVSSLLPSALIAAPKQPLFVIRRPTVVAFFVIANQAELNDPDTNEALADFQFYAKQARESFRNAGVDFAETYADSFKVQQETKARVFRPGKVKVGYYLTKPGREPHIEYGVLTDADLLQVAGEYFGFTIK